MIPIAFGSSGHKSLTSKTKVFFLNQRENIPGIPAVNGVLVAKTKSYSSFNAMRID